MFSEDSNQKRTNVWLGPMRSVPPRGSGWVPGFAIADCRLPIGSNAQTPIENRQSLGPPATEAVKRNVRLESALVRLARNHSPGEKWAVYG